VEFGSVLSIKVMQTARYKSMWFGLVRLIFKKSFKPNQTKPNQCGLDWFVGAVYREIKKYYINSNIANLYKISL